MVPSIVVVSILVSMVFNVSALQVSDLESISYISIGLLVSQVEAFGSDRARCRRTVSMAQLVRGILAANYHAEEVFVPAEAS